jgi:hypothetical protein
MQRALVGPFLFLLCSCQTQALREPVTAAATTSPEPAAPPSVAPDACVLVCGNATVAHPDVPKLETHVDEAENADAVFASMHEDLLACYKARVIELPSAHAFLTVVVAPDGSVQKVDTTGGALFGDRTMRCVTRRIHQASFAPVRGGGTIHIQIPLSFTLGGDSGNTI